MHRLSLSGLQMVHIIATVTMNYSSIICPGRSSPMTLCDTLTIISAILNLPMSSIKPLRKISSNSCLIWSNVIYHVWNNSRSFNVTNKCQYDVGCQYLRELSEVWSAKLTVTVKQVCEVFCRLNVSKQLEVFLRQLRCKLCYAQLQQWTLGIIDLVGLNQWLTSLQI